MRRDFLLIRIIPKGDGIATEPGQKRLCWRPGNSMAPVQRVPCYLPFSRWDAHAVNASLGLDREALAIGSEGQGLHRAPIFLGSFELQELRLRVYFPDRSVVLAAGRQELAIVRQRKAAGFLIKVRLFQDPHDI